MYCTSCGKQIPEDAQICAYCGKRLGGVVTPAQKRLLRAREGRQIAGVCKGFANYFDFDVALVRIVWVLCAVLLADPFKTYKGSRRPRASSPLRQEPDYATRKIALKAVLERSDII